MSRAKAKSGPGRKRPKNYCFGCGLDNPDSMRLKFTYDKKRSRVIGRIRLAPRFAGPPGYAHGGIIATILDEAMAKLNKLHGVIAVTGHLAVDYLRPVPLGQPIRMEAHEVRTSGRRRFREAEIVAPTGEVLARGQGIFITIDPKKMFAKSGE
jgi:uncharacterized protein (TIGR00369 family)